MTARRKANELHEDSMNQVIGGSKVTLLEIGEMEESVLSLANSQALILEDCSQLCMTKPY